MVGTRRLELLTSTVSRWLSLIETKACRETKRGEKAYTEHVRFLNVPSFVPSFRRPLTSAVSGQPMRVEPQRCSNCTRWAGTLRGAAKTIFTTTGSAAFNSLGGFQLPSLGA